MRPYDRGMTPRAWLLSLALLFALGAAIAGLSPRSVDDGIGGTLDCGSLVKPVDDAGFVTDTVTGSDTQGSCDDKRSSMKPLALGSLGLAGVALIVSFAVPQTKQPTT